MKYVNLGCGEKYIKSDEWINLDFNAGDGIIACNILKGLPFSDDEVDVIYSCCMLEHFTKSQAENLLIESNRCLKDGGVLRIVVPDMENWAREYLNILDKVRLDEKYKSKYNYIIIELIDQMVRTHSGGTMQDYWLSEERDEDYIIKRTGYPEGWQKNSGSFHKRNFCERVRDTIRKYYYAGTAKIDAVRYYRIGKFCLSGEQHKWMYDSYSLKQLLVKCGFSSIKVCAYNVSGIEGWDSLGLEVDDEGREYKPNCLYIEGVKN